MREYVVSVLLLLLIAPCFGSSPESSPIPKARKLQEYKQHNLGLMDLSSDGRLLLMHQKLPRRDPAKSIDNHRLRVIDAATRKERAAIELQSSEPYMLFRPGSHQVLLNGELKRTGEVGCFLWDVDSGTVHKNAILTQAELSFVQFMGPDQLLGSASPDSAGRRYLVYDFDEGSLTPFHVSPEETHFLSWDPGLTFSPDFMTLVGRTQAYSNPTILTLREWETRSPGRKVEIPAGNPARCIYSPDGRFLIVVSNVASNDSRPIRLQESYLHIFDAKTLELKRTEGIFRSQLAETWILHVGFQMAVSPDGRWLIVGYDRYTEKLLGFISYLQATYAVLEFPSLTPVASAEHPEIRTSYEWADVSPAQSGRLRFNTDSSGFYTTSKYTIHWAVPGQGR